MRLVPPSRSRGDSVNDDIIGVECGECGGPIYMETCRMTRPTDHDWTIASECQRCGARHEIACVDCD